VILFYDNCFLTDAILAAILAAILGLARTDLTNITALQVGREQRKKWALN
jgi:hypothetical protein